ncbi:MAG: hypothetical protein ACKO3N_10100 [Verrucomicrobiota bacterium]
MFGLGKPKNSEEHRYYLLPGQGRGNRRKHRIHLFASLAVGLVFAVLLSALMWYLNER